MKVFAPGKLVLTGAYAVLDGAPAIVLATNRGAFADTGRTSPTATPEVRAALGDVPAPHVDASSLFLGARKLGLGASAAIVVASLGARDAERGVDLAEPRAKDALFARARAAHAAAQGGGSGVDVAASVYGGVLEYRIDAPVVRTTLPAGLSWNVMACATSAKTAELRDMVAGLGTKDLAAYRSSMGELSEIAIDASRAVGEGNRERLLDAIRRTALALARLGDVASAPIVPPELRILSKLAVEEGAAFCVSGAGGGDVAIFAGSAPPSVAFLSRAKTLGLFPLDTSLDEKGVRVLSTSSASFAVASA